MTRRETLETAIKCVCGDREEDYGSPENNFQLCADLWNTYLHCGNITAHDVGIMMTLLKVARIASGRIKDDSYIDAAGYLACAAEIITSKGEQHADQRLVTEEDITLLRGGRQLTATDLYCGRNN